MRCCEPNHEHECGGVSRRNFLKICTAAAVYMGLEESFGIKIAEAVTNAKKRPPVIWLSGQGCTGCTETLLRPDHPTVEKLIIDLIALDYNETLNTGAGHQAEEYKKHSIEENAGKFILVVEGSIPTKDNGIYCQVAGQNFIDIVKETAARAAAVIAIGSCASWGGIPSSGPNPTGAKGLPEILKSTTVVTIPGCPPNPYNFLSTVLHYLTFNRLPELDDKGRPKFAYSRLIHENCERRPHFDAGRFAEEFGDEGHRKGYCLYKLGCKGPQTYANCPAILFNDVGGGSWPVGTGHPCFGCTEQGVGFSIPLHSPAHVIHPAPSALQAPIIPERPEPMSGTAAALAGGAVGAIVGASAMAIKRIGEQSGKTEQSPKEE